MPFYENVFITRQDMSTAQVEALADQFAETLSQGGGRVVKREYWGLKNLAYRVRKNRKGHYVMFNIDAPPAAVNEMERTMRINEDVLRLLTIRVDELEEGPSAIMRGRGERERSDRGDRGDRFDRGDRGDRGDRFERGDRGDRSDRSDRGERGERGGRDRGGETDNLGGQA
ncbi:MAG: 30S ribosomal protein S6 [Alphaproteobacteria bacterium]